MRFALLLTCLAFTAAATEPWWVQPTRAVEIDRSSFPLNIPYFDNGYLVYTAWREDAIFNAGLFDREGKLVWRQNVALPDGRGVKVMAMAPFPDGRTVVSVIAIDRTDWGLLFLDVDGKPTKFVSTKPFGPMRVCLDGDGNIWTRGHRIENGVAQRGGADYAVVRKYDSNGKLLLSALPWSSFPEASRASIGNAFHGWPSLQVSDDRVGLYNGEVWIGNTTRHTPREWIEIDFEGNLIGRWLLPDPVQLSKAARKKQDNRPWMVTLMPDNRLFCEQNSSRQLFEFNREEGEWRPASGEFSTSLSLMGQEGDELVFLERQSGPFAWLKWFPAPAGQ